MNEEHRDFVRQLRLQNEELLTDHYDKDFNLLRWAQGYGFSLDEATVELRRHLQFRRFYDMDNIQESVKEHDVLKKYFPIGLVGETGKDNNLLVIECAGKIDLMGILKSVHLSDFLIQRYRFQEKMLRAMNEVEKKTGKQAAVIYVLDLDGLKFDPSLLSIVTGPYRILWASVYTNYPEWIDKMFIINAPSFLPMIWKAVGPLLPERTRNKVRICGSNADQWQEQLKQHVHPENLPKFWGGKLVDSNGDGMCRDRLNIPSDPIPQTLYWTPSKETPDKMDLTAVTISAGKAKFVNFIVPSEGNPRFMVVNRFCDRTFGMGVWYSPSIEAVDWELSELEEWMPDFDYPGMPTTDLLRVPIPGPGIFRLKLGNEGAWIRSLQVFYRIRFTTENGVQVDISSIE